MSVCQWTKLLETAWRIEAKFGTQATWVKIFLGMEFQTQRPIVTRDMHFNRQFFIIDSHGCRDNDHGHLTTFFVQCILNEIFTEAESNSDQNGITFRLENLLWLEILGSQGPTEFKFWYFKREYVLALRVSLFD